MLEVHAVVERTFDGEHVDGLSGVALPEGVALVGELAYGQEESKARVAEVGHSFMDVFDILSVDGEEVWRRSDIERRRILEEFLARAGARVCAWFHLLDRWTKDFREHFKDQSEGLVLKRVKGAGQSYHPGTKSPDWIKVVSWHTYDVVVMDYHISKADSFKGQNVAQGVTVGAYIGGKLKPVCRVGTGLSLAQKRDIPRHWDRWQGRVLKVKAKQRFKSGSLRHPSVVCLRDDKDPEDCKW